MLAIHHRHPYNSVLAQQFDNITVQQQIEQKEMLNEGQMKERFRAREINSQYIQCLVEEGCLSSMVQEYVQKVVVNGATVRLKDEQKYQHVRNKVVELYYQYFFGSEMSSNEFLTQYSYIVHKFAKYKRYQKNQEEEDRCIWTENNQQLLETNRNYMGLDQKEELISMRSNIDRKIEHIKYMRTYEMISDLEYKTIKLNDLSIQNSNIYRHQYIVNILLQKIQQYSNYFRKNVLIEDGEEDFQITWSILNMHLWLIVNRLNHDYVVEGNLESEVIAKQLTKLFDESLEGAMNRLFLRRGKKDFMNDTSFFMNSARMIFDRHFNVHQKTGRNPLFKLDALIWSKVFMEKEERYSQNVYNVSNYLVSQYQVIMNQPIQDIYDSYLLFSIYSMPYDTVKKMKEVNRDLYLDQEQFEKELENEEVIKKFFYSYTEQDQVYGEYLEKGQKGILEQREDMIRQFLEINEQIKDDYGQDLQLLVKQEQKNDQSYHIFGGFKRLQNTMIDNLMRIHKLKNRKHLLWFLKPKENKQNYSAWK